MRFTENPKLDLDSTEYDRQEVFNLIEETNPTGSCLVLSVDYEIADGPAHNWDIEAHFYVVEIACEESPEKAWALFEISWDDNDCIWRRSPLHGVQGVFDQGEAIDLLMNEYWKSLNLGEDDRWAEVLKPFRRRAEKIVNQLS